jgi:Lyase
MAAAPVAVTLRRNGVSPAAAVAYWLGNPLLNPAVLGFLFFVSPWQWTLTRMVVGIAAVLGVAVSVGFVTQQISALSALASAHRATPMVARTLTQYAAPTTFGAKAARWLNGVLDACERLRALVTPIQLGGAVGTHSATTELATLLTDAGDPAAVSDRLVLGTATTLGLDVRLPWHTTRTPVTAAADALVGCTDCWGAIASDVVTWVARRSPNSASRSPKSVAGPLPCHTSAIRCCPS